MGLTPPAQLGGGYETGASCWLGVGLYALVAGDNDEDSLEATDSSGGRPARPLCRLP